MKKLMQSGRSLSKQEQKMIMGGACTCWCTNGPGEWTYDGGGQPSQLYLGNDITEYCGNSGGNCNGCVNWPQTPPPDGYSLT